MSTTFIPPKTKSVYLNPCPNCIPGVYAEEDFNNLCFPCLNKLFKPADECLTALHKSVYGIPNGVKIRESEV